MSWWANVLYGPEVFRSAPIDGAHMRSRRLEFEEVQRLADQLTEFVRSMTPDAVIAMGGMSNFDPDAPPTVEIRSEDGVDLRMAKVSDLTALELRSLELIEPMYTGLRVVLAAGTVPRVENSRGLGSVPELFEVARLVQRYGHARVWWHRWPAAVPWALLLAAGLVGVPLGLDAGGISGAVLAALVLPLLAVSAQQASREISTRLAMRAPGMLIYQQPRAQLRADRENRRANARIAIFTAIPAAVVGAFLQAWLG